MVDCEISTVKEASKILDQLVKYKSPIVIFCKWMKEEAVAEMVYNINKGTVEVGVVTLQGSNEFVTETLRDLACLFNSTFYDQFNYDQIFDIKHDDIGSSAKIDISEFETFFISSEKKSDRHSARIAKRLREVEYNFRISTGNQKKLLEDRVSRLSGNMGLIKIGGNSEAEQKEIKDKLTDGLNAVRNVMEYGALPGGGAALVHSSKILDFLPKHPEEDIQNGIMLMKEVVMEPMKFILDNAKLSGSYHVQKLLEDHQDPWIGYCARTNKYGNMMDLGVIDSFHNIKNILIDASSIGSMLLTTECVIYRNKRYDGNFRLRSHSFEVLQKATFLTNLKVTTSLIGFSYWGTYRLL